MPTARTVAPLKYWMGRARQGMGLTLQALDEYRLYVAAITRDSPEPLLKDAITRMASLQ